MLFFDLVAILCQILLLYALFISGGIGTKVTLYRYFNPFGFLCLFYGLFYILEQVYYETNDFNFVGRETFPIAVSRGVYNETQIYLILFLFCVWLGSLPTLLYLKGLKASEVKAILTPRFSRIENALLIFFFAIGMVAIAYLGRQLVNITDNGGFRGLLVKNSDGLIATTISFFANYAFAVLLSDFLQRKRYILALLMTIIFATGIFYTGARGRLMWPLLIAFMIFFSARNRLPLMRMLGIGLALIAFLTIMDPLKKALTSGGAFTFADVGVAFSKVLSDRNFDGFTVFSMISATHIIQPDVHYLAHGIREVFNDTFFPQLNGLGVALATTIPGYFFLGGGLPGFMLLSMLYGLLLGTINIVFRKLRDRWLIFSYFFAMSWICAVAGDTVESINKMVVSASPGLVILAATMFFGPGRPSSVWSSKSIARLGRKSGSAIRP